MAKTANVSSGGFGSGSGRTIIDTTTSSTIIYIGKSQFAEATSADVWLIKRITTTSGADIEYVSLAYDQVWDDRASLTYNT